jgi:predicted nucleic acid-binding protein
MTELWVVNASPLITLAKAGQLVLLQGEDRGLVVPQAVRKEVMQGPGDDPARKAIETGFDAISDNSAIDPMVLYGDW